MSGQIKFSKVNPEYDEYNSQMQILAKIQYKNQNRLNPNYISKNKLANKEIVKIKENFIEEFLYNKKYKDEIIKWY